MTLTGAGKSEEKEQRWEDQDVDLAASGSVGKDLVVELKLNHDECQDELQFTLFRGDVPMPSDRYKVQARGNVVQLTLKQSQKEDSGHYALVAKKLSTGLSISGDEKVESKHRIHLSIHDPSSIIDEGEPPIFLRRLSDLAVKVGTRTRFLVEIRSPTTPKVTWHKNDELVYSGSRFSFVHEGNFYCVDVAPVMVDDQGHWTCMAENGSGRSSCTSFLSVIVPKAYKKPEFVEELRALLTETGTVSLECKVVGVPTPVLKWFKDQKEIKAGDVFALTANPEDPTSLGTYTCEAANCMGTVCSSSKVHVVGKGSREGSLKPADALTPSGPLPVFRQILRDESCKIGDSLTLSCQVHVPPWPKTITWYNKEGRIEPSEKYHLKADGLGGYSIEIKGVEAMDEGEWKCVATSAENMKQFSTCHVAMSIPKNYRLPRFMESLKAVLTEEGLVSFECKVVGFPTPLLRWFKDGQELHPGDVYQLTGTNSLGSYCCIARNCMGEAKSIAELTIEDIQNQLNEEERMQLMSSNQAPKFVKGLRSCEARINEDFTFTIQVSVSPEPSLSWYRDDVAIIESEKYRLAREALGTCNLEVKKLEFMDQAEWKCIAANDFGHSVTSCFLKLVIPKHFKKPKFLESLRAILSEEGAVNLECKVIGVPQPILKWYKDGIELKPGDIHRIISGQDGTCCLGTYTCEATNCMGSVSSSASLLGFEDRVSVRKEEAKEPVMPLHELARNLSLSTIHEERTSQLYDTPQTDHSITMDDRGEVSFSFDGKEVSVSLYETPDLTEEEALQIVEMYADQLSEHITEGNVIELPPMRFTKETSTTGNLLMEAVVIDVSPDYFVPDEEGDDLRTEADVEDVSIMDDQMQSIRSSSYVSSPTAEIPGDRLPSGSPPSRPPRRKESRESFSSRSEKSEKSLAKGYDWSESYHSAKEPSMQAQSSIREQDDSGEAFTDALSSSGAGKSRAEDSKDIYASFAEQNIEKIPLDETMLGITKEDLDIEENMATQIREAVSEEVTLKRKKKKKDRQQSSKASRTPSLSSKASSEESFSMEVDDRGERRASKNGKERRDSVGSTKSEKGRTSRRGSGKLESTASPDLRRRGSDATIIVENVKIEQIEAPAKPTNELELTHTREHEIIEGKATSATAEVSTVDREKSALKRNKERLLECVYELSQPIMSLRNALVDLDKLLPFLQCQGSSADVERSQAEITERIILPVENLCEQVAAIETKALKSAADRSLAQNARISLLEAIGGPTEELLRGIELMRRDSGQHDVKSNLIVLESLTDPVDEILMGLTRIERDLTSSEDAQASVLRVEKPIALERMTRAVSSLGNNIANTTERNIIFGDESTSLSVIERLQSVYQSLEAFLSTVPLSESSGALENNVDTLVVETLVRPLEDLTRNLNSFSIADAKTRDNDLANLKKSMMEMRTRLEALTIALETYEKESGEKGITELHADLVKFLRFTMDDASERLEKSTLKKKRVTQGALNEGTIGSTTLQGQLRMASDEAAFDSTVESSEPEETNVSSETTGAMKQLVVPPISQGALIDEESQFLGRPKELSVIDEKSSTENEEAPAPSEDKDESDREQSTQDIAEGSSSPEKKVDTPPELDTDLSLPEMLLDPLIDVQANLSDVISDFESQESGEESSLPGGSELAACLTELRESVATAAHTATTLKSAKTVEALVDLREPLLDLQIAMASAVSPAEVKLIKEAVVPLAELKVIVTAAIGSSQASEASQIQMKSVLRMLDDIEAEVKKMDSSEIIAAGPKTPEVPVVKKVPTRPPEDVERAAIALTGVHFALSTVLERVSSSSIGRDDLTGSQGTKSLGQTAEHDARSSLIVSIEKLRESVGDVAVTIGSPIVLAENDDHYSYEILFDELAKLEGPLLNLQRVLLTEQHEPEDRHVLNDVANPIRSLKEIVQNITSEVGNESNPPVLELIEDVEKDVTLVAMEALKKALAEKSKTSDDDSRESISSLSKPGEVSAIISKWFDPIENWLSSAIEESTEIEEFSGKSSIAPAVDYLKRELLKIAIQTAYSEPPSDVALIEYLTELQDPLVKVCQVLNECHEPENLDIVEGLVQPMKHLLGMILDASLIHEAGKVLRPVLEAIEELENQIPLTIKRATYERELQRVVRSMTPEDPRTLTAEDIPESYLERSDRSEILEEKIAVEAGDFQVGMEESVANLSQESKPGEDKMERIELTKSVEERAEIVGASGSIETRQASFRLEESLPQAAEKVLADEISEEKGMDTSGMQNSKNKVETLETESVSDQIRKEHTRELNNLTESPSEAECVSTTAGLDQENIDVASRAKMEDREAQSESAEQRVKPSTDSESDIKLHEAKAEADKEATTERKNKVSESPNLAPERVEVITVDNRQLLVAPTPLEAATSADTSAAQSSSRADQLDLWSLTLLGPLDRLGNAVLSLDRSIDELAHGLLCRPLDSLHKQIEIAELQFNRPVGQSLENDVETIIEGFLSPVNQLHSALAAAVNVWNDEQPRLVVRDLLRSIADSSTELCELLSTLKEKLTMERANQSLPEQQENASLVETINAVIAPLDDVRNLIEEALKKLEFVDANSRIETDVSSCEEMQRVSARVPEIEEGEMIDECREQAEKSPGETVTSIENTESASASAAGSSAIVETPQISAVQVSESVLEREDESSEVGKATEVVEEPWQTEVSVTRPEAAVALKKNNKVKEDSMHIEETTAKPLEELIEAIVDSSSVPGCVSSSPDNYQSATLDLTEGNIAESPSLITEEINVVGPQVASIAEINEQKSAAAKAEILDESDLAGATIQQDVEISGDRGKLADDVVTEVAAETVLEIPQAEREKDRAKIVAEEDPLSRIEIVAGPEIKEISRQAVTEIIAEATEAAVAGVSQPEIKLKTLEEAATGREVIHEECLQGATPDDSEGEKASLLIEESLSTAQAGKEKSLKLESPAVSQDIVPEDGATEIPTQNLTGQKAQICESENLTRAEVIDAPKTIIKPLDAALTEADDAHESVEELLPENVQQQNAALRESDSLVKAGIAETPETKMQLRSEETSELESQKDDDTLGEFSPGKMELQEAEIRESETLAKLDVTSTPEIKIKEKDAQLLELKPEMTEENLVDISDKKIEPQQADLREDASLTAAAITNAPEVKIMARQVESSELEPEVTAESLVDISHEKLEQEKAELRESENFAEAKITDVPEVEIKAADAKLTELEMEMAEDRLDDVSGGQIEDGKAEIRDVDNLVRAEVINTPETRAKEISQLADISGEDIEELVVEKLEHQKAELRVGESLLKAEIIDGPETKIKTIDANESQSVPTVHEERVQEILTEQSRERNAALLESESELGKAQIVTPEMRDSARISTLTDGGIGESLEKIPEELTQTSAATVSVPEHVPHIAKIGAIEVAKLSEQDIIEADKSAIIEILDTPMQKIFKVKKAGKEEDESGEIVEKIVVKPVEEIVAMEEQHIFETVETPDKKVIKMKIPREQGSDNVTEGFIEEIVIRKPIEGWAKALVEEEERALSVSVAKIQEFVAGNISHDSVPESSESLAKVDEKENEETLGIKMKEMSEELLKDELREFGDQIVEQVEQQQREAQENTGTKNVERKEIEGQESMEKEQQIKCQENEPAQRDTDEKLHKKETERQKDEEPESLEKKDQEHQEKSPKEKLEMLKREEEGRLEKDAEFREKEEERLEKEEADKVATETLLKEKEEAARLKIEEEEKLAKEKLRKEKEEAERLKKEEEEKLAIEKLQKEKEEAERLKIEEEEKLAKEKLQKEKEEAERLKKEEEEKLAKEKLQKEKEEAERLKVEEEEKLAKEKLQKEKEEAERLKKEQEEKLAKEKLRKEKEEAERLKIEEEEKLAKEKLQKEKEEADRLKKEEEEKLAKEKLQKEKEEAERLKKEQEEKLAKEKLRKEKEEAERVKIEEEEKLAKEKLQKEKEEADRLKKEEEEKLAKEKLRKEIEEAERIKKEEAEKREKEKLQEEQQKAEKLEKEKLQKEKKEAERLKKEEAEKEKLAKEKEEAERLKVEEEEKLAKEKLQKEKEEAERLRKEQEEKLAKEKLQKEKEEAERLKIEEEEKIAKEKLQKDKEEAERLKKEEEEKLAKKKLQKEIEEAERIKKEESEKREKEKLQEERQKTEELAKEKLQKEKEEADRLKKEEAEKEKLQKEKEEAERLKIEEEEKLAKEKLQKEKEEAERLKKGEEEKLAKEKLQKEIEAERMKKEESEKREKEKLRKEKEEAELMKKEAAEKEKLQKQREEAERMKKEEAEKREKEKLQKEKEEAERMKKEEAEKREKEKLRKEKEEAERMEKEAAEKEKLQKEKEEAERMKKEEAEKSEKEKLRKKKEETERMKKEAAEREKLQKEKEEAERMKIEDAEKSEKEKLQKEKEEAERMKKEAAEKEKLQKEKEEAERMKKEESEKREKEKLQKEKDEAKKQEQDRLQTEKEHKECMEKEKAEKEKIQKAKEEAERVQKEEAEKFAKEKLEKEKNEAERIKKEETEKEKLRKENEEAERMKKEEAEKQERDKLQKEKEEAERLEKEKAEKERLRKAREEAERVKQEEAEKLAKEKLQKEKEEAERLEEERAEKQKLQKAKEEAERVKKEETEKRQKEKLLKEKEDAERMKKEDAKKLEREELQKGKEEAKRLKEEEAERLEKEKSVKEKEDSLQKSRRSSKNEDANDKSKLLTKDDCKEESSRSSKKEGSDKAPRKNSKKDDTNDEVKRLKKKDSKEGSRRSSKADDTEDKPKRLKKKDSKEESPRISKKEESKEGLRRSSKTNDIEDKPKRLKKKDSKEETPEIVKKDDSKQGSRRSSEKGDSKIESIQIERQDSKKECEPSEKKHSPVRKEDPQDELRRLKKDSKDESEQRPEVPSQEKGTVKKEKQFNAALKMPEDEQEDEKTPINSEQERREQFNEPCVRLDRETFLDREPRSSSTIRTDSEMESEYSESTKPRDRGLPSMNQRRRSDQHSAIEIDDTSKERSERRETDRQRWTTTRDETLSTDDRHYTPQYSATSRIHEFTPGPRDRGKKPSFCMKLTDRTAAEGSRIKLTCTVLGDPEPQVYWTKDGKELPSSSNRHCATEENGMVSLELYAALPKDSGEYSCIANNVHGQAYTEAKLKVYAGYAPSPARPTFTRSIKDTYRSAENELVLECRVRGQPSPKITWHKDGQALQMSDRYQQCDLGDGVCRLKISRPDFYDSGLYTCKAENESKVSDCTSHVVNFDGKGTEHGAGWRGNYHNLTSSDRDTGRPKFSSCLTDHSVPIGGTIALQVEVKGVPPPDITWLRGDRREPIPAYKARTFADSGVYTLIVPEATESETGTYVCRASNAYGYVDTAANVEVISSSPGDGGKPAMFVSRPAETMIHVTVGEDVSVSFRVSGIPKPRIVWMKGLRDITNGPRSYKESSDDYVRLTLKRAVVSDEGTYCIMAKNRYGCDRTFYTVKVKQRARSLTPSQDWGSLDTDNLLTDIHDTQRSYFKQVPGPITSEPVVVDGGRNWLALSWGKAVQNGPAPVVAYRVDAWLVGGEGGARWVELGITPVNAFDAFNLRPGGEYKFRITPRNRYGWGEAFTMTNSILVRGIVKFPEFTKILPGQLKALRGETLHLECEVRSESKAEVKWYRDTTDIDAIQDPRYMTHHNGSKCTMTVQSIKENDSGRYVCEATNPAGRVSTFARVQVVNDPKIVEADEKLRRMRTLEPGNEERPPEFTMRLRDRRVQMTYPVRLTCQVSGHPEPEVTWYKNREEIFQDDNVSFWDDESHFHTLEISHSSVDDSGVYMAKARNFNGSVSCRCNLVVDKGIRAYVAPEFLRHLDAVYTIKLGGELRMTAQIEAYPTVGIVWHRDGHRLRPSRSAVMSLNHDGSVELSLAHVTPRDAGLYCCTATNEVGQAESNARVTVIGSTDEEISSISQSLPDIVESLDVPYSKEPLFVTKPLSTEAVEGDTVIILCEVVGDPKPEVIWLRDFLRPDYYRDAAHFRRVGGGPQYRLEIPYAKLDFTGAYTVIAKNCHGEAKAIISLQIYARGQGKSDSSMEHTTIKHGKVQTLPSIKRPLRDLRCCDGDAVTLICKVYATPEPDVRWEKSGKLLPLGEDFVADFDGETARLSIQHVYPEDEGEYTCVAYNNLGKAFTSACLIVDVPEGKENALSRRLIRPIGLLSAESTPISTPRSTPIRSLSPSCVSSRRELKPAPITSRGGSTSRRPRLPTGPKFYAVPHNRVAEEGETVRFQCAIAGHPMPWVTWDKDGVSVTPTARISLKENDDVRILEITEINHEDAGLYRITLENDVGRTEATARLEIIKGRQGSVTRTIRTRSASPRTYSIYSRSPITSAVRGDTHLRPNVYEPMGGRGGTLSPTLPRLQYRNEKSLVESPEVARRTNKQKRTTTTMNAKPRNLNTPNLTKPRSSSVPKRQNCKEISVNGADSRKTTSSPKGRVTNEGNDRSMKKSTTRTNGSMIPKRLPASRSRSIKLKEREDIPRGDEKVENFPSNESHEIVAISKDVRTIKDEEECQSQVSVQHYEEPSESRELLESAQKHETHMENLRPVLGRPKEPRPPIILAAPADVVALRGTKVILLATYDGEPQPRVRWLRKGRDVRLDDKAEIETSRGLTCLTLDNVTTEQTGKYAVTLENIAGRDCRYVNLTVEGVPDPPAGTPCVQSITRSGKAIVTWRSPSYDGGCAVTGYSVEMKRSEDPCWIAVAEARHSLSHTVTGLAPEDTYRFRVRAENAHGLSEPSAISDIVTVPGENDEEVGGQVFTAEINQIEIEEEDDFEPAFEARIVTPEDGSHFAERYEVMEELGKGRYGVVRRIVEKSSGINLAAKIVRTIKAKDRQQVYEEIGIMNRLRHPKLLRLAAAYENPKDIIMVTEYISGGELFERVVADDFTLTEKDSIQFVKQICEGVEYMHKQSIVHLDLKPENVMCHTRTSHRIKLIDFGLAQTLNPDTPIRVLFGTPEFIPPEIIGFEPIGTESDMWSIGVICYVLLTGLSPFMGDNDAETFANITRADYDFDDKAFAAISTKAKDFISSLLIKRKESRMSARQCLEHPWLAQQAESMSSVALPTDKLKKFIVRRKWQKTGNAIRALGRMAILSANSRKSVSAASSPTKTNSFDDDVFNDAIDNVDGFKPIQPVVIIEDRILSDFEEKSCETRQEIESKVEEKCDELSDRRGFREEQNEPEFETLSEEKIDEKNGHNDNFYNEDYNGDNNLTVTEVDDVQDYESNEGKDISPLIQEIDDFIKNNDRKDEILSRDFSIEELSDDSRTGNETENFDSKHISGSFFTQTIRKQSFSSFANLEITETGAVETCETNDDNFEKFDACKRMDDEKQETKEEEEKTENSINKIKTSSNTAEDPVENQDSNPRTTAFTKTWCNTNNSTLLDEEDESARITVHSRALPFVRTGSVSRKAKMFEQAEGTNSSSIRQQQHPNERTTSLVPEARPKNERVRQAFAFWNK